MPYNKSRKKRRMRRHGAAMVLLYVVLLAALAAAALLWDREAEAPATFGSLEGRFDSDIRMELDGDIKYYRENEITNCLCIIQDSDRPDDMGGTADVLLLLSMDRRHRTVTPVMLDRDTLTALDAGETALRLTQVQGMGGCDATAGAVSGLLQGVVIDHWLLVDREGAALLSGLLSGQSLDTDAAEAHMRSDAALSTLYNDAAVCADYVWQPLIRPAGTYSTDGEGGYRFAPDMQALRETVAQLWYK